MAQHLDPGASEDTEAVVAVAVVEPPVHPMDMEAIIIGQDQGVKLETGVKAEMERMELFMFIIKDV